MSKPRTICIDFDDTICMSDSTVAPHAKEVITQLHGAGHKVLILTARLNPRLWGELVEGRRQKVITWLEENQIPYADVLAFKPPADVYIDDKALRFRGDWRDTLEELTKILGI